MKKLTHAWLALKAMELLKAQREHLDGVHRDYLDEFLTFISAYPATFVRGAWFPDAVIRDQRNGGHTWKYLLDPAKGRVVKYRLPAFLPSQAHLDTPLGIASADLASPVSLVERYSDLPDRCEALGQTIRDMVLITNKSPAGDLIVFNNSQIALFLLMLAHYVCDAHVPMHCDGRSVGSAGQDGYHLHNDLEALWEREVEERSIVHGKGDATEFVLDEEHRPMRRPNAVRGDESILGQCERLLDEVIFTPDQLSRRPVWTRYLGRTNGNFWDYVVAICRQSLQIAHSLFPGSDEDYLGRRLGDVPELYHRVVTASPIILADAVTSVAVLWYASWERYRLQRKVPVAA